MVFAHPGSLKEVKWGKWNTITLNEEGIEGKVRQLKQMEGKNMVIFASSKLVQSFANAGFIDEYRILVHPVILGTGKRLFESIKNRHSLTLVDTMHFALHTDKK